MKKALIIGGCVIILMGCALGAWAYLMYTGTTVNDVNTGIVENLFATGNSRDTVVSPNNQATPSFNAKETLRQLSTRKVIGSALITTDLGTVVRFAEAGTGHLYEVPLVGNGEIRISNTTFHQAKEAVWSPLGNRVVLMQERDGEDQSTLGTLTKADDGSTIVESVILASNSHSFSFNDAGDTLYYAVTTSVGTKGFVRDLKTRKETTMFDVPLRDVTVTWTPKPMILTKASGELIGYAYRSDLSRITEPALALRGIADDRGYAFGGRNDANPSGWLLSSTTVTLDRGIVPDKCALTRDQLICGIPKSINMRLYPEEWYRGQVSYDDTIYAFNRTTGASVMVVDPSVEARRELDVLRFDQSDSEGQIPFIAKNDRTLWLVSL